MSALSNLAGSIRADLEAAEASGKKMVRHYVKAGELLLEAKSACGHGEWLPFLRDQLGLLPRQAQRYMRLSANASRVSHFSSLTEAMRELSQPTFGFREPKLGEAVFGQSETDIQIWLFPAAGHPGFWFWNDIKPGGPLDYTTSMGKRPVVSYALLWFVRNALSPGDRVDWTYWSIDPLETNPLLEYGEPA